MSDLASWLELQIAEDERIARDAALSVGRQGFGDERVESGKAWSTSYHLVMVRRLTSDQPKKGVADCGALSLSVAKHIANFDPARVLAECEAKRRIIALHPCDNCGFGDDPCETLSLLALPYADRPGYDESWRP